MVYSKWLVYSGYTSFEDLVTDLEVIKYHNFTRLHIHIIKLFEVIVYHFTAHSQDFLWRWLIFQVISQFLVVYINRDSL